MWITLAQNTASSSAGPLPSCIAGHHAGSVRSIRSGGRMFGSAACARHASILFRCRSLRSLGHQVISGVSVAKCTTCWPVPLPASTTSPDLPARNGCSTAQMGAWLRWNAAASSRPSGSTGRPSLPNSTTYSAITASPENRCRSENAKASLQFATIDLFQHLQQAQCTLIGHAIMQRLRRAPEFDQPIGAQFRQMLRQGGLAQLDDADQFPDRHLATHGQKAEDQQALFVGEHFQELGGFAGLLRQHLQRRRIVGAGGRLWLFGCRRGCAHNVQSRMVFRACEAHMTYYRSGHSLALTKLANVDTASKKQEMMRRCGREGKKTCGITRYAAKLFSPILPARTRLWG